MLWIIIEMYEKLTLDVARREGPDMLEAWIGSEEESYIEAEGDDEANIKQSYDQEVPPLTDLIITPTTSSSTNLSLADWRLEMVRVQGHDDLPHTTTHSFTQHNLKIY